MYVERTIRQVGSMRGCPKRRIGLVGYMDDTEHCSCAISKAYSTSLFNLIVLRWCLHLSAVIKWICLAVLPNSNAMPLLRMPRRWAPK